MKKMLLSVAALLAFIPFVSSAEETTIAETAMADKNFSTLCAAVKAAGLAETLKGKGPMTVFAPTNDAFAKLGEEKIKELLADKELLAKILKVHVVEGTVMAADVVKMDGKMVNGQKIVATTGGVTIGGAKVTKTDIKCTNGVIHVIDTVLMPAK